MNNFLCVPSAPLLSESLLPPKPNGLCPVGHSPEEEAGVTVDERQPPSTPPMPAIEELELLELHGPPVANFLLMPPLPLYFFWRAREFLKGTFWGHCWMANLEPNLCDPLGESRQLGNSLQVGTRKNWKVFVIFGKQMAYIRIAVHLEVFLQNGQLFLSKCCSHAFCLWLWTACNRMGRVSEIKMLRTLFAPDQLHVVLFAKQSGDFHAKHQ